MRALLVVLLLTAGICRAQDTIAPARLSRVIIKLTPLTVINYDPTIQGAVEIRTGVRQSWQGEFGYSRIRFGSTNYSSSASVDQREYWRARTEYRWYRERYWAGSTQWHDRKVAKVGHYYAVEGYFKQINAIDRRSAGRDCASGNCTYYEILNEPVARFVEAFYVKYGKQVTLYRRHGKVPRLLFDLSVGLGVRGIQVTRYRGNPENYAGRFREGLFLSGGRFDQSLRAIYPDATLNFKIGYAL